LSIEVRLLTADDDLEPDLDLSARAFGSFGPHERESRLASARATVSDGHHLAVFDGPDMVASARYHDLRQWWRGRSLPAAGVASVKVAPEERGRGVGTALVGGLLGQMAAGGFALSVLYAATNRLYRSAGWELAGGQYEVTLPARSLLSLQPPDPLVAGGEGPADPARGTRAFRRAGPADAAEMNAVLGGVHAAERDCGPVTYDAPTLARLLDDPEIYCYQAPDGLLVYRWNRPADEMLVYRAVAGSARTARALWSILASHGTMVAGIRAFVNPADPVNWLVREPDVTLTRRDMWMLRLLDAPAAIAGRGYPEGARVAAVLSVQDPQLPANSGQWLLEVGGGQGTLTRYKTDASRHPRSAPPLCLGARGLAALYAGTPLAALRSAGLVSGGLVGCGPVAGAGAAAAGADAALDEAFAGTPYMLDYF
jgi:predicted N-acetyltransferase YhbS